MHTRKRPMKPEAMDAAFLTGAVSALRRRAASQTAKAREGIAVTEAGIVIRTGESAIANRIAEVLAAIADEFEQESP
jgi:hypothetical protein